MASKFDGFSLDEINKVSRGGVANKKDPDQRTADAIKPAFRGQHGGIRRVPEKWTRSCEAQRKQATNSQSKKPTTPTGLLSDKPEASKTMLDESDPLKDIKLDGSMSKSIEDALFYQPLRKSSNDIANAHNNNNLDNQNNVSSTTNETEESSIMPTLVTTTATKTKATTKQVATQRSTETETPNTDSPFKGVSLREFEAHRKLIEEQNKQKKDLLYKTIELHSQKTAAEVKKIAEIKQELAKLDNDLALDVSILRKQIDNACIYFAQVEKQYIKIEAQFLKAKMDLHNAAEKKELLTEHLCTVIAHNEDRKAQKLSELMQKVGLTETGEVETGVKNRINGD